METAAGALPAAQSRVLFQPCLRMVKSIRNKSSCLLHKPVAASSSSGPPQPGRWSMAASKQGREDREIPISS